MKIYICLTKKVLIFFKIVQIKNQGAVDTAPAQ